MLRRTLGPASAASACAASRATACSLKPTGCTHLDVGSWRAARRAALERARPRPAGRPARARPRIPSSRRHKIDEPAERGEIRPMDIVHQREERLRRGEIGHQPVQAVKRRERRARRPRCPVRRAPARQGPAAPASSASRVRLARRGPARGSSSCRTIPKGSSRSSSPPRALTMLKSPAVARAAASRLDLPIPGAPSTNHRRARPLAAPTPAAAHSTSSSSLAFRQRSRVQHHARDSMRQKLTGLITGTRGRPPRGATSSRP